MRVSGATLAVAVLALGVVLLLRWIAPRVPAAVVVVAGIALSALLNLDQHGVAVVGHIPSGLPSLAFPTTFLTDVFDLVPAALGLFLVSFADEILTARSSAQRHGDGSALGRRCERWQQQALRRASRRPSRSGRAGREQL